MEDKLKEYKKSIKAIINSLNEDSSPYILKVNSLKVLEVLDKMKKEFPDSVGREAIELIGTIDDEINLAEISEQINRKKGTKKSQKEYEERQYEALSRIKSDLHLILNH